MQAEYLGDAGRLEESERVNDEIQKLRRTREDLIIVAENPSMMSKQNKICDVCGGFLAVNDTEKRNETHLAGRSHTGFLKLREELQKLIRRKEMLKIHANSQKALKKEEYKRMTSVDTKRRSPVKEERGDRDGGRDRKDPRYEIKDRERNDRDGGRDRERNDRDRDDRKKERRSRSKERNRSKDRERRTDKPRERSPDRNGDRDKDRKKHKKDKDRKKRSRSRSS